METRTDRDLEVALSGGGLRAAAFGLGVLLYLVHSGLNKRVATIASVSGGSITNGYVASRCDFGKVAFEDFRPIAAQLAQTFSGKGRYRGFRLWSWPPSVALGITAVLLLIWLITIVVPLLVRFHWKMPLPLASGVEWLAFFMIALVWATLILNRDYPVQRWIRWTFFRPRRLRLALQPALSVDHVFCTTDLTSGCPLFYSTNGGGRIFSPRYGRGQGGDVYLDEAVARSAAFPPLISPASILLSDRQFTGPQKDRPPKAWLTDGGVWNNLGTDWHNLRSSVVAAETAWIEQASRAKPADAEARARADCPSSAVLLIANASKPEQMNEFLGPLLKTPGLSVVVTAARVLSVSVTSIITGRVDEILRVVQRERVSGQADPVVVPMIRRPDSDPLPGEANLSAVDLEAVRALRQLWESDEVVATTFNNIGREKTLLLIVRGYLNTRRVMTGKFGDVSAAVPSRDWFESLVPSSSPG